MTAPGGRRYAVGDRVVALAPLTDRAMVTSERGVVIRIGDETLTIRTARGTTVSLRSDEIDARHLDHAYAVTVHRVQGATVDRTHLLADGGGRELAYVAMSRARHTTHVHVVADDLDQARDDLRREWSAERRDRWILDVDQPVEPGGRRRPDLAARVQAALRHARLAAEREAVVATLPPDRTREILGLHIEIGEIDNKLVHLERGTGAYHDRPVGSAVRRVREIEQRLRTAEHVLTDARLGRRMRRQWTRDRDELRRRLEPARTEHQRLARPIQTELTQRRDDLQDQLDNLKRAQVDRRTRTRHLDVSTRVQSIDRELGIDPTPGHEPDFGIDHMPGHELDFGVEL